MKTFEKKNIFRVDFFFKIPKTSPSVLLDYKIDWDARFDELKKKHDELGPLKPGEYIEFGGEEKVTYVCPLKQCEKFIKNFNNIENKSYTTPIERISVKNLGQKPPSDKIVQLNRRHIIRSDGVS